MARLSLQKQTTPEAQFDKGAKFFFFFLFFFLLLFFFFFSFLFFFDDFYQSFFLIQLYSSHGSLSSWVSLMSPRYPETRVGPKAGREATVQDSDTVSPYHREEREGGRVL